MPPSSKRRKTSAVQEVVFDTAARQEYLTGFHKRKQARIKHGQEIALKREKAAKREAREKAREERQRNLEEHVRAVNESIGASIDVETAGEEDEDDAWGGLEDEQENEYVDEDQFATVTVEDVDITRDGFVNRNQAESDEEEAGSGNENAAKGESAEAMKATVPLKGQGKKRIWTRDKPSGDKPKRAKKRNFKYESKEDRKANRAQQRGKNKAQAMARKARSA